MRNWREFRSASLAAAVAALLPAGTAQPLIAAPVSAPAAASSAQSPPPLTVPCVAFSPYVAGYNPDSGPHPPPSVIDNLLDRVLSQTTARCIMTYGVLNGLDHTFEAAKSRGVSVIAIIWLDADAVANDASITRGIQRAKEYAGTITRVSCGSEVATRHGPAVADPIIRDCIARLKAGGVLQPITSIDTWWEWCNRAYPCQQRDLVNDVDWLGINIFPWWENRYSGLFTCTTAAQAADFHVARRQDVASRYPGKELIVTEFGWPAGPDGYSETNVYTHEQCGTASVANQQLVINSTVARFNELGLPGIVFEAFREPWKTAEGVVGPAWGFLETQTPWGDYDGDRKADLTVFRPSTGDWVSLRSLTGMSDYTLRSWGLPGDIPVGRDYDGDGTTDPAVYRPSLGRWVVLQSSTNYTSYVARDWGLSTDTPVPADYDGDGKADFAVFRPSLGRWVILLSSTGNTSYVTYDWGLPGDLPMPADYNGDGLTDVAVFRPSTGRWYILNRFAGTYDAYDWGLPGDIPAATDFDGDGKADITVYRPSLGRWFILQSTSNNTSYWMYDWGLDGDVPVPADYDADGRADVAVYRPSNGTWYVRGQFNRSWGLVGDVPALKNP